MYLSPDVLRAYASKAGVWNSKLVEQLFYLSRSLYGVLELQACHYRMFKALINIFDWVRDNIPLLLQEVPGQPQATAAWPDLTALSEADFTAAVSDALLLRGSGGDQLADAAATISGPCGLSITEFAALVPNISSVLMQLHADLAQLQRVGAVLGMPLAQSAVGIQPAAATAATDDNLASTFGDSIQQRRAILDEDVDAAGITHQRVKVHLRRGTTFRALTHSGSYSGVAFRGRLGSHTSGSDDPKGNDDSGIESIAKAYRRRQLTSTAVPSTFIYSMPPGNFSIKPPSANPRLLIPIVFHIMQYVDAGGRGIGPANYELSPTYAARLVQVANYMGKPAEISFFIKV
ncbi:hypothetical protein VOLCADRAFT_87835 [Volvox carteri f. nagariensis]|uniref:Uncharacterized protein n=1 Tax=Volvox carteri f. nagariensis TaxID=3068 RepID=D8TMD4_VOLCA|nr:uncharacterized protein VOLCADRAFT_87835 [Volvox carteri f. nagariensis]EFJ51483.1 hypothetical protein VOLCADRAFT_87835 [Volvox carteri f. nagariensis]|eukprot:XP_002947435.1 hypothetical protein VOLCADRAFT_87835 [Volvox carteri f. nagariensis]